MLVVTTDFGESGLMPRSLPGYWVVKSTISVSVPRRGTGA